MEDWDLIRAIQEVIRRQYGGPHRAWKEIDLYYQLRGEKPVSEDTVTRIYNYTVDGGYRPRVSSLRQIAGALGIPYEDERERHRQSADRAGQAVEALIRQYRYPWSCRLLVKYAEELLQMERHYSDEIMRGSTEGTPQPERPGEDWNRQQVADHTPRYG